MQKRLPLVLALATLVLFYIGERVLTDAPRYAFDALAALAYIGCIVTAFARMGRAQGDARRAYGWMLVHYALFGVALVLYVVQLGDVNLVPAGKPQVALQVIWPAIAALGLLPVIAMESSLAGSVIELPRVRAAARAARIVVLALIAFAGINYAASVWNKKVDLSYFRTSQPSESTLALVRGATNPIEILLFYPVGNDVLELVQPYAETLAKASEQVTVRVVDQALDTELAKELKIRNNGFIIVRSNGHDEQLKVDVELDEARTTLRNLDQEMQTKIIKAIRPARIVYMTTGHGERDTQQATPDGRASLADFKSLLDAQGFTQKRYGLAEGSSGDVPDDASMLIIAGATQAFLPAEVDGIAKYLARGGRLLLLAEPDDALALQPIASLVGVDLGTAPVAAQTNRVRLQDRAESAYYWATGTVPQHASEQALGKAGGREPLLVLQGGTVTKKADAPASLTITATLKSGADSWVDANRNGAPDDPAEKRGPQDMAQALEGKTSSASTDSAPARAIVVGDCDMISSGVLSQVRGNFVFFLDGLRWLGGDDTISGVPASEKDVPILHRKEKDAIWFFGTSFLVPALVLAAGLTMSKRARRSTREVASHG